MNEKISIFILKKSEITIKEAMKQMDLGGRGTLIFLNKDSTIKGLITDGDIRKAILNGMNIDEKVESIINTSPFSAKQDEPKIKLISKLKAIRRNSIPLVDENGKLKDIFFLNEYYHKNPENKEFPVVILAGGKGTRLDPFTKILPKPLIPINNEPMIENIINRFNKFGFENFLISVNYKKEFIKMYFNYNEFDYKISFIEEDKKLGTVGPLSLVKDKVKDDLIMINCDTIIFADYEDILNMHKEQENVLTVVTCMKETKIPYGVIKLGKDKSIKEIKEKPEYHHQVLVGFYVLNKKAIDQIPDNKEIDITDLIEKLIKKGEKVGIYPLTESSWFDVGQWEEYQNTLSSFKEMKLN